MAVPNFRITTYGHLNSATETAPTRPLGDYGDGAATGGGGGFPFPFGGSPTYPHGAVYRDADGNFYDQEGNQSWDKDGNFIGPSAVSGAAGAATIPAWLKVLTTLGTAVGGHALSNMSGNNNVPPELRQLLQMQLDRQNAQTPNFQAVTQGLHAMLPTFAKTGT